MKMKFILPAIALSAALTVSACAEVNADFAAYEDFGKVISAEVTDDAAVIEAEGYFGYHMDAAPSMTVSVTIAKDGTIQAASVIAAKDQTPGFDAAITQEYMDAAYVGKAADPAMETDSVSGATATSKAVRYAVQTAANYAQKALGFVADTDAEEKAELAAVFPAEYTTITTDYQPDTKKIGTIMYAASGVTADGQSVIAMKVKSATKVAQGGSAKTGWDSSIPNAFVMIIVIDQQTSKVVAYSMVKDGTRAPEYFAVPAEKLEAYQTVEIIDGTVFDEFMDGIIMKIDADYEVEDSTDGPVITGTSIVYTGATQQGTFSSQLIRNCFRAAADFYCAVK